jgi:starch synthase
LTEEKDKLWILSFEYAGIIKVGGLGEVPANQAKNLTDYYDITVFIPSHGQIERLKKTYFLEKIPFKCTERIDLRRLGLNTQSALCEIGYHRFKLDNVNIVLLTGENNFTINYLDDNNVYDPDTLSLKILLFSIGMRAYTNYIVNNYFHDLPKVLHMHDYHVVIPFLGIKQELSKANFILSSIITIHLLTYPKYDISYYYACGIDDTPITVLLKDGKKLLSIKEIFELCKDSKIQEKNDEPPTVEKIGALASDLVTTVSESYLKTDIIPNLGNDLIEFKSDFVWDGCDWEYDQIYKNVLDKCGNEIREKLQIPSHREITQSDMKQYLLTYKISHLSQSPLISSKKILEVINEISNGNPFIKNGDIKGFEDSGPLVIATGRISRQKGFETIFNAIPDVIKVIPNAKFLLLMLPTEYSLNEIKIYSQFVKKYPTNLRIIFGVAAEIFQIAHIAANAYCALSRWEPFGIIALEAMATKLPVIATKVGGLQESIIDIRKDPINGTGILIEKDNPFQFANALITIFILAELSEKIKTSKSIDDQEKLDLINKISDELIKARALVDNTYYDDIKENCIKRVDNYFRWDIVTKKLLDLYKKLQKLYN